MSSARDAVLEFTGSKTGEFRFKGYRRIPSVPHHCLSWRCRTRRAVAEEAVKTGGRARNGGCFMTTMKRSQLCESSLRSPCELFSWPSLVSFSARSDRGRAILRALAVTDNNSGDNELTVYGSFDGYTWHAYENNPS